MTWENEKEICVNHCSLTDQRKSRGAARSVDWRLGQRK